MAMIEEAFAKIPAIYIADGHHRCASAVKVGLKRREQHPDYTGEEEFNYFLSVIFPDEELQILDYNRVVKDLNGMDVDAFLAAIEEHFMIEKKGTYPYRPEKKGAFGMFLEDEWYCLTAKKEIRSEDAVEGLDVSLLQNYLLNPVLGIEDPKTDKRIDLWEVVRGLGGTGAESTYRYEGGIFHVSYFHRGTFCSGRCGTSDASEVHLVRAEAAQRSVSA